MFRKVGKGVPASFGVVSGALVFSSQEAIEFRRKGISCILCLPQSSANDIGGLEVTVYKFFVDCHSIKYSCRLLTELYLYSVELDLLHLYGCVACANRQSRVFVTTAMTSRINK